MRPALRLYSGVAVLLLNTLVALIVLNVVLFGFFRVKDSISARSVAALPRLFNDDGSPVNTGNLTSYQLDWFDFAACREAGEQYAADVLDDFSRLAAKGFMYQPWVQFSEPLFRGKRLSVEVDALGFPVRRTVNGPSPADPRQTVNVFVFGGSTTFGYHVADEDTWPSQLAKALNDRAAGAGSPIRVRVTNHGRGYFNPSQELALFVDLLKTGYRPTLAIFMDGVNVGSAEDIPDFSPNVTAAVAAAQTPQSLWRAMGSAFRAFPMARLRDAMQSGFARGGLIPQAVATEDPRLWGDEYIEMAARRFAVNRALTRAVAREFGVEVRFFLQPNAPANYPVDLYRRSLPPRQLAGRERARKIYDRLRAQDGIIDLSSLFEKWGPRRKAIVDYLHYSPAFSRFLAEEVARHIDVAAIAPGVALIAPGRATGQPRHAPSAGRS